MRLVYKGYADGQHALVKTDDEGNNVELLEGNQPPRSSITRVPIYIEVSCDDSADIIERTRTALKGIVNQLVPGRSG